MDATVVVANVPPKMLLECPHCGIVKADIEEIEIHLKVDHIGWLPFQCPECQTVRATDGLMREHVFAAHKNSVDTQFLYNDNKMAKKELQLLVHKALFLGVQQTNQKTVSVQAGSPEAPRTPEMKHDPVNPEARIKAEVEMPEDPPEQPAAEANLQLLNMLFAQGGVPVEQLLEEEVEGRNGDEQNDVGNIMDMLNAQLAIQNMAMMFPAAPMAIPQHEIVRRRSNLQNRKRVVDPEPEEPSEGEVAKQAKIEGGSSENEDERREREKQSEKMRLTDISRHFGGCHYLARPPGSTLPVCEICQVSRKYALPEHAYIHMDHPPFACPFCDLNMASRKSMLIHIRDVHKESDALPVDNRLKYAVELKETIRQCYPTIFVDADTPTNKDLVKLTRGADEVALREDEPEE